jgi:hypothetical protein
LLPRQQAKFLRFFRRQLPAFAQGYGVAGEWTRINTNVVARPPRRAVIFSRCKVERVVLNALPKWKRLCRLIFAPSAMGEASSSGEADPPAHPVLPSSSGEADPPAPRSYLRAAAGDLSHCVRPNGSMIHGQSSALAQKPAATGFCRM